MPAVHTAIAHQEICLLTVTVGFGFLYFYTVAAARPQKMTWYHLTKEEAALTTIEVASPNPLV